MYDENDSLWLDDDQERTIKSIPAPDAPQLPSVNGSKPEPTTRTNNARVEKPESAIPYFSKTPTPPPPPPSLPRESAARERMRRRRVQGRKNGGEWAWVIIAVTMLGVAIILSLSIFLVVRASQSEPEVIPTSVVDLSSLPTPVSFRTEAEMRIATGEQIVLDDGYSFILQPWDGQTRFTVLMMGIDRRPGETGLAYRTDTMILVSVDPTTDRIGILNIPRDLYVQVPGYAALQRVNAAMVLGEGRQGGYGPVLAMQTVQLNLGIPVHDYIVVDFNAVIGAVDAIGGIEVSIDYTINDRLYPDMNFGYDPFYLAAGTHHLDGRDALRFARTRHGDSDIERQRRQQQVLYAIRDRVLDLDMIPQLIIQAPTLLKSFEDHIYTGLTLEQMIQLAWYLKDIPRENITTGVIDYRYLMNYTTPEGNQVLIPNRSRLGNLMIEVFGSNYTQ